MCLSLEKPKASTFFIKATYAHGSITFNKPVAVMWLTKMDVMM